MKTSQKKARTINPAARLFAIAAAGIRPPSADVVELEDLRHAHKALAEAHAIVGGMILARERAAERKARR